MTEFSLMKSIQGHEQVDLLQMRHILPAQAVESPRIRLKQEHLNGVHCSSDIFRCTLTKIPESSSILQKSRLPLGILIHPFKDLTVSFERLLDRFFHPTIFFLFLLSFLK